MNAIIDKRPCVVEKPRTLKESQLVICRAGLTILLLTDLHFDEPVLILKD